MSLGKAYQTKNGEYNDQEATGLKFDMVKYMIKDEMAPVPDSFVAHRKRVIELVTTTLNNSKSTNPSIIEIGCGIGSDLRRFEKALGSMSGRVAFTGVDIMPILLEAGKGMGPKAVTFLEGDLHSIPAKDNTFDVVYCSRLLIHSTNLDTALGELHRVLKPGGTAVAVEAEMTPEGYGPLLSTDPIVRRVEDQKLVSMSNHFANVAAASTTLQALKKLEVAGDVRNVTIEALTSCVTNPLVMDPELVMSTQVIEKLVADNEVAKEDGNHYLNAVKSSAVTGEYILNSTLYCISWVKV